MGHFETCMLWEEDSIIAWVFLCARVLHVAKPVVSKHRWQIKALGELSLLDPIFPWSPTDSRWKGLCALYGSFLTPEPINMVILVCKCQRMWSSGTTKHHDLSEKRWTSEAILICNSVNQLTVYSKHRPCFLTVTVSEGINDLYHFWIIW